MMTAVIILGALLAGVGLIALRPKIDVSKFDAIQRHRPFTIPFKVSNVGLLAVHNLRINCYVHRIQVGRVTIASSSMQDKKLHTNTLDRGESLTVICQMAQAPMLPRKTNIEIVIDFNVTGVPFKRFRRVFRFVGT